MITQNQPNHSRCFKCIAIPIGWAVDEVWPVVKAAILKIYNFACDLFFTLQQQLSCYASSSCKEIIKGVFFLRSCALELYNFPQGTIRKILFEFGSYFCSAIRESFKGTVTVLKGGNEFLDTVVPDLIIPSLQESMCYLTSGIMQVNLYADSCKNEALDWSNWIAHRVAPIALEAFSYSRSGSRELWKGLNSAVSLSKETASVATVEIGAVVQEGISYQVSGLKELWKTLLSLVSDAQELYFFLTTTALKTFFEELASYLISAKKEIESYSETTKKALQETGEVIDRLDQTVTEELTEATLSGFYETVHMAQDFLKECQALFSAYLKPVIIESLEYTLSGFHETANSFETIFLAADEATSPLRKAFQNALMEIKAYQASCTQELQKCIFRVVPESLKEGASAIGEIPAKIVFECLAYLTSGRIVVLQALITLAKSLQEAGWLPKEVSLAIIKEWNSYLHSLNRELAKLYILLKKDVPLSLQHAIGDPLIELTWEFVKEYRNWRRIKDAR